MLKKETYTHVINSKEYYNDNMAYDFSALQSHASKDEISVISKGWCARGALSPEFIK